MFTQLGNLGQTINNSNPAVVSGITHLAQTKPVFNQALAHTISLAQNHPVANSTANALNTNSQVNSDVVVEDDSDNDIVKSQINKKFMGMPKAIGVTVLVGSSLLVLGVLAYFIFRKKK